jgi:hypothetical protein
MPRTIKEIDAALTACAKELREANQMPTDTIEQTNKKLNTLIRLALELQQHKRDLYEMV